MEAKSHIKVYYDGEYYTLGSAEEHAHLLGSRLIRCRRTYTVAIIFLLGSLALGGAAVLYPSHTASILLLALCFLAVSGFSVFFALRSEIEARHESVNERIIAGNYVIEKFDTFRSEVNDWVPTANAILEQIAAHVGHDVITLDDEDEEEEKKVLH